SSERRRRGMTVIDILDGDSPAPEPLERGGGRAIVFVQGLGGQRHNFLPMAVWCRRKGRGRARVVGFEPRCPVRLRGERLTAWLRALLASVPAEEKVDIVAHGLGGICTRLALEDEAVRARV